MIDLRSDTLTAPCAEMRAAMASAPVGDDVIDVDPTVARLQEVISERLGMEAAMFMPSGSMTNQVAIRLHCRPGDEFICESGCHIYNYEQGAFAQLSQTIPRTIDGPGRIMHLGQLTDKIRPDDEHAVRTRLLCLENTHNKGGGIVLPYEGVKDMCSWAHDQGLTTHLDGARFFNAVVASKIEAATWAQHFDTVSICFSKGLGAPVGSALVGSKDHIHEMRRHRKLFGGGMRQSGIIAAGALFALENNIDRLAKDHQSAMIIAEKANQTEGLEIDLEKVHTNIVIFKVDAKLGTAAEFCDRAKKNGVWMFPFSHEHVRAVTHLHISEDDAETSGDLIMQTAEQMSTASAS